MTTPTAADLRPARLRLWSNWLWILAGILGIAVLWSAMRLIHDQRIRREALRSLAQDKATEVANLGAARFDLLMANAFGSIWTTRSSQAAPVLASLANDQAQGQACKCRETLPITRFFRFDASTTAPFDAGTQQLTSSAPGTSDGIADSTLVRISLGQFDKGMQSPTPIRDVEIVGRQAVITITRPAGSGPGTKVYGAIVPVADLAATLFGGFPRGIPVDAAFGAMHVNPIVVHGPADRDAHMETHRRRLVELDSLGLGVAAGTQQIFGSATEDRPYVGIAVLRPPLEDFRVYISMAGRHVSLPLLMPVAHDRLWLNGILVLATVVVMLFAIGSSRREVALARARSDFVAGISHDLRMPLAQILLASETLSLGRDRNETERASLMGSILREARRLKAMIDNVLLFSRSGAVGIQPNFQNLDVGPLLDAVMESVSLAVADAGQRIETRVAPGTRVVGDRALLHQAIVNLIDNAMKYGPTGQRILLTGEAAGDVTRIAVEDEGPGIPKSARDRLFEPYERLARDNSSERTGSGLGLAVVRQIVLACHGGIRIEDAEKGTRIVITLPAAS